ncbi:putative quinol monooxygenase [Nocardioides speluncae]|uniref:putative quinol monooxygenase n=1 Tax=Nocardioides speluncae TaxID=2670337 RepID=UPI000D691343|nr:antibiotic biosynthesis monooxygenase [Nocardioides speluncae]
MSELQAIVRFKFYEGKLEEFKRLSAECLEIVRAKDPGTLQYDTFLNHDESEAIVIERFRDSAALIEHHQNLVHLMEAITATGECTGELLGEPTDELAANFEDGGVPQLFRPFQVM